MTYVTTPSVNDLYVLCLVFLFLLFFGVAAALAWEWLRDIFNRDE
jgi:hypothetical protein